MLDGQFLISDYFSIACESNFNHQNVATGDLRMHILFTSPREAHVVLTRPEIILRVGYKI